MQIAALELFDPPLVIKKLKAGWRRHIPLNACTNTVCLWAARITNEEEESLLINGGGRVRMVSSKISGADRELFMSGQDFIEAFPRLVRLISTHYPGPERLLLVAAYEKHFTFLLHWPDFWVSIEVVIAYDIAIRCRHLQSTFNPGTFQKEIWANMWTQQMEPNLRTHNVAPYPALALNARDYAQSHYPRSYPLARPKLAHALQKVILHMGVPPGPLIKTPATVLLALPVADLINAVLVRRIASPFIKVSALHAEKSDTRRISAVLQSPVGLSRAPTVHGPLPTGSVSATLSTHHGAVQKSACDLNHLCSLCGRSAHTAPNCRK